MTEQEESTRKECIDCRWCRFAGNGDALPDPTDDYELCWNPLSEPYRKNMDVSRTEGCERWEKRGRSGLLPMQEDKCRAIAYHYGPAHQAEKAMEELHELSSALDDKLNGDGRGAEDVTEEIADVYVMLYQISYLLGIDSDAVSQWIDSKIARQLKRIGEGTDG